ncbi:hypothetical protein [Streptomyces virginiae]|uniref:hypothetical protein n=1 Tax=Streptomyces virginiae TaxID=1961 RepID=UPI002DBE1D61|nr:hypothetical protein [Streptomyces sp. CMAA1738]MEC4576531.1 hypothetical protein [Streptomyces sp. CMAA1738]
MQKTWFEEVFRTRPHPMLRLLGSLALCAAQLIFLAAVITHFDTPWRWLYVPVGLWAIVADGRGAALAVQDLRQPDTTPTLE